MMEAHHPQGAGPLCGAQIRYQIVCDKGLIGGLGFRAPAWRLAPRDAWIGWDEPPAGRACPGSWGTAGS